MNRILVIFLVVCGAACSTMVAASEAKQWEVVGSGVKSHVIASQIDEIIGNVNEDKMVVLHRAGRSLVAYSASTGFEACAEICKSVQGAGVRYGLVLTTAKAHLACPILPVCPEGFERVGENIHSHGSSRVYRINRADAALSHFAVGQMQRQQHNHFAFSGEDLSGEDGIWLARPDGLLFSARKGTGVEFFAADTAISSEKIAAAE